MLHAFQCLLDSLIIFKTTVHRRANLSRHPRPPSKLQTSRTLRLLHRILPPHPTLRNPHEVRLFASQRPRER